MNILKARGPYPLIRLLFPFLLGISWQLCLEPSGTMVVLLFTFASCALVPAYFITRKSINAHAFGLVACVFLFSAGMMNTHLRKQEAGRQPGPEKSLYIGKVMDRPVQRTSSCRVLLRAMPVAEGSSTTERGSLVHGYLPADSLTRMLGYGDRLLFFDHIREVPPPANPGEFDYRRYLFHRGVTGQVFLSSSDRWQIIGRKEGPSLKAGILRLRYLLIDRLEEYMGKGNESRVLAALTLGYRQELDAEIRQDFAAAGAMHFLAISGLHVGILFFLFHAALAFLTRIPHGKTIRAFLVLLLLWLYASLTGFSPPVTRAVVMFSFFTAGRAFNRHVNTFNILASSAFLLLLVNPFLLADTGFQLSYLAVAGIVFFQPRLGAVWKPSPAFLRYIWVLITVALSAQLVTFPLTTFYFHLFPNYFILSNLLVLPLVTFLLPAGVLFFLAGQIPFIGAALGWLLKNTTWLMNSLVRAIHALPGSTLEPVYHSLSEVILLYLLLAFVTACLLTGKKHFLHVSLLVLLVFTGSKQWRNLTRLRQEKLVVYHSPGNAVSGLIRGKEMWLFHPADSLERFEYSVKNHLIASGIKRIHYTGRFGSDIVGAAGIIQRQEGYFVHLNGKILAVIDRFPEGDPAGGGPMEMDILVVSGGGKVHFSGLEKWFSPGLIVLDSSVRREQALKWEEHFRDRGTEVHPVISSGAFICDL